MMETRTLQCTVVGLWRGRGQWFVLLEAPLLGMKGRKVMHYCCLLSLSSSSLSLLPTLLSFYKHIFSGSMHQALGWAPYNMNLMLLPCPREDSSLVGEQAVSGVKHGRDLWEVRMLSDHRRGQLHQMRDWEWLIGGSAP